VDDPAPDPAELAARMNEVRAKGNYAPKLVEEPPID
jgi:hypothetical protein